MLFRSSDCSKPVICAVNGAAFGAGFALMLACDIMIAADDAYFVMPEVDVGLAGGAGFLMQHFGKSMARYMYFTARRIPAAELYRLGVISACVPREKLMDEAMQIAHRDRLVDDDDAKPPTEHGRNRPQREINDGVSAQHDAANRKPKQHARQNASPAK